MGIFAGLVLRKIANDVSYRKELRREEQEAREFVRRLIVHLLDIPEDERNYEQHGSLVHHRTFSPDVFDEVLAGRGPGKPDETAVTDEGALPWYPGSGAPPTITGKLVFGRLSVGKGYAARVWWLESVDGELHVLHTAALHAVEAALGSDAAGRQVAISYHRTSQFSGDYTARPL